MRSVFFTDAYSNAFFSPRSISPARSTQHHTAPHKLTLGEEAGRRTRHDGENVEDVVIGPGQLVDGRLDDVFHPQLVTQHEGAQPHLAQLALLRGEALHVCAHVVEQQRRLQRLRQVIRCSWSHTTYRENGERERVSE